MKDKVLKLGYIEGHGIGPDIWNAARPVFDKAFEKYGKGEIEWHQIKIGKSVTDKIVGEIKMYPAIMKGPLTTPVGGGIRSLNVQLRQALDLYVGLRPVKWFEGLPSPVKHPEKVDIVIFRENTEDVYSGMEVSASSSGALKLRKFLKKNFGWDIRSKSGIGIKPISEAASKRLIKKAFEFAKKHKRKKITLVHKGNIMKFTEGAFRDWGYQVAKKYRGIQVNDVIADAFLQQILTRPDEFDVIATMNLNGDYISDAIAAQVGGIGLSPSANIGDRYAIFETTHGTAPKYAGMDKVNPMSMILSGAMMFDYLGYPEVSKAIKKAVQKSVRGKKVTYDLARQMKGARVVKCSEFGQIVMKNL